MFRRQCLAVVAVLLCLIGAGCNGGGGSDTPEEAFEGYDAATKGDDRKAVYRYLSPRSKDHLLASMANSAQVLKVHGEPSDVQELEAILARHGVRIDSKMKESLDAVSDKDALLGELAANSEKRALATGGPLADLYRDQKTQERTITQLKIEGTKASATVKSTSKEFGTDIIHFVQVDGLWYIDLMRVYPDDFQLPIASNVDEVETINRDMLKAVQEKAKPGP